MAGRIVYLNGQFVAESEAKISIFDRGFMFGDSVYEVVTVINGALVDFEGHVVRLKRSLGEIDMDMPITGDEIRAACERLIEKNKVEEGGIYMQISRGAEDRDFQWSQNLTPTIVMFSQQRNISQSPMANKGLKVTAKEDIRWGRRDIKTTMLLPQSLYKQRAAQAGYDDVWLYDVNTDLVNEGASNNAYILTHDNILMTCPPSNRILNGITRQSVLTVCEENGYVFKEEQFTLTQAKQAKEAFVTSATTIVMPVVQIDEAIIGSGKPGEFTLALRQKYFDKKVS